MKRWGMVALLVVLSAVSPSLAYPGDVAIIVSKENGTNEVSFRDLARIFKLEQQYWDSGKKIYLVMRETGAVEKETVLAKIYQMDDAELKTFWLGKLFRQEIASFPTTLSSDEAVKRFVSQVPNAVGFLDAAAVDDRVMVLRIDGKLPMENGYKLTDRQ